MQINGSAKHISIFHYTMCNSTVILILIVILPAILSYIHCYTHFHLLCSHHLHVYATPIYIVVLSDVISTRIWGGGVQSTNN